MLPPPFPCWLPSPPAPDRRTAPDLREAAPARLSLQAPCCGWPGWPRPLTACVALACRSPAQLRPAAPAAEAGGTPQAEKHARPAAHAPPCRRCCCLPCHCLPCRPRPVAAARPPAPTPSAAPGAAGCLQGPAVRGCCAAPHARRWAAVQSAAPAPPHPPPACSRWLGRRYGTKSPPATLPRIASRCLQEQLA
jgi:hypothetical protein